MGIQTTYRRLLASRTVNSMRNFGAVNGQVVTEKDVDVTTEEGVSTMTENECRSIDEDKSSSEDLSNEGEITEILAARDGLPQEPARALGLKEMQALNKMGSFLSEARASRAGRD